MTVEVNRWPSAEHALEYLRNADTIPHRVEGEATLLEFVPREVSRVLDVGSGGGRLVALIKTTCPQAEFVAMDFSPTMLETLRERFNEDPRIEIVEHDFSNELPDLRRFDGVVSSFAIHHVNHERKCSLYSEIFDLLLPGGVFCNLEHVSSSTSRLHVDFLAKLSLTPEQEDPSNKLLDVGTQLGWLQEIGFEDVDCHWKWRELALLVGKRPA